MSKPESKTTPLFNKVLDEKMTMILAKIYARRYDESPQLAVARLCDEEIDKSGALLGDVRTRALEINRVRI